MTNTRDDDHLLHADLTRVIIGAAYALHTQVGGGFLEAVYSNGLAVILRRAGVAVAREVPYEIQYHGETIGRYRADLVVDSRVVVEVKAGPRIDPWHRAQLYNYLRVSGLEVGLLITFGTAVDFKRVISTRHRLGGAIALHSG